MRLPEGKCCLALYRLAQRLLLHRFDDEIHRTPEKLLKLLLEIGEAAKIRKTSSPRFRAQSHYDVHVRMRSRLAERNRAEDRHMFNAGSPQFRFVRPEYVYGSLALHPVKIGRQPLGRYRFCQFGLRRSAKARGPSM
jgi:hypothetical protein